MQATPTEKKKAKTFEEKMSAAAEMVEAKKQAAEKKATAPKSEFWKKQERIHKAVSRKFKVRLR